MKQKPLYIDIHILQSVPPSNINRDDTGSPKIANFGGVTRARVSSQAWKKASRDTMRSFLDEGKLGQRTKYAVELIGQHIVEKNNETAISAAQEMAAEVLAATGIKVNTKDKSGRFPTNYLLFISPLQAEKLADLAIEIQQTGNDEDEKSKKKALKKAKDILNAKELPELNAIDIALFGRMVADALDLNTDASVQVAHAIGVSRAEPEFDYFTALDDRAPEDNSGAGMIGTVEFMSSTLYRYANVDVYHLYENLGSVEAVSEAVRAFLRAFVTSMPTGKMNTFANRTLPSVVLIQLRDAQPVSLVNAFETPVTPYAGERLIEKACCALVEQEQLLESAFGVVPEASYAVCAAKGADVLGDLQGCMPCSFDTLIDNVDGHVNAYLDAIKKMEG